MPSCMCAGVACVAQHEDVTSCSRTRRTLHVLRPVKQSLERVKSRNGPGMVSKIVSRGARESAQPTIAVCGAWPCSTRSWRMAASVQLASGRPSTKRLLPSCRLRCGSQETRPVLQSSRRLQQAEGFLGLHRLVCGGAHFPRMCAAGNGQGSGRRRHFWAAAQREQGHG